MNTSDTLASLALVVALISFWLSYKAARLSKNVAAAEKRTEAHTVLIGVLIEAEDLLNEIRDALQCCGHEAAFTENLRRLEAQIFEVVQHLPGRLNWLRRNGSDDPVLLEEYKAYVLEVEARLSNIGPEFREVLADIRARENA